MNKLILYKKVKIMKRIAFLYVVFLSFCTTMAFAQQGIPVSGTVTEQGDPLPGVAVVVKGTTTGTITAQEYVEVLHKEMSTFPKLQDRNIKE